MSTRELASLIWIGVVVLLILIVPRWRRGAGPSFKAVIKSTLVPSILTVFGLFVLWCAAWVAVGVWLGYWDPDLLVETIIIVLTVGFPILFRSINSKSGTAIVRHIANETVALSALLLFYINLEPFPLWAELIIQPTVTFLVLLRVVASRQPGSKKVEGCLGILVGIIGVSILVWSTVRFVLDAPTRDWDEFTMQLALSIWLPLVMFPFFYGVTFYAAAQVITRRMRCIYKPPALRRATFAAVLGLHFRLRWAREFGPRYDRPVVRARTFREALARMRDFREEVEARQAREADRIAHVAALAGQQGTDGTGAQLDRREFDGTKRALDFIGTAEGLRYVPLGNRYWNDLTDMVIDPVERYGFTGSHGITVETTRDGQVWRAWRRLPSGWVLAIGGRDGQPAEHLYSGAEPPATWPGDKDWSDRARALELPIDWIRDDSPTD